MARRTTFIALALGLAFAAESAHAQALSTLWPNGVGNRWEYEALLQEVDFPDENFEVALELTDTRIVNGDVEVQTMQALLTLGDARGTDGLSGFWRSLWLARPDLREEIERVAPRKAAADYVPFDLIGGGLFRNSADGIGYWREELNQWAVLLIPSDLATGATYTMQLVPDLADDVYLHGQVVSTDASVSVPAGTFANAVQMSYRIDFGESVLTDVDGVGIGTLRSETTATAYYVPFLGLASHVEEFEVVEANCPSGCPDIEALIGVVARHGELSLRLKTVGTEVSSWGALKSTYE